MKYGTLSIDKRFIRPTAVDERIFGAFVEHLGNVIYHGLYDPHHPQADEDGFRKDVIELVRALGLTVIRYPGGNSRDAGSWIPWLYFKRPVRHRNTRRGYEHLGWANLRAGVVRQERRRRCPCQPI